KHAYCLKTQPATGETYPKSDLFNKAACITWQHSSLYLLSVANYITKNTEIELQSKAQTM
ncbi:hypothetical protein, partial [Klebsiella pneumoniae]|uniref:hypothetical protein n=1 Tax=Klebsiella pneumoniae TaxID=573 RepID=UPI002554D818